jgi:hypothetical protein
MGAWCLMVAGLVLLGCNDGSAYTLVSARGEHMRLHIATFDANEPYKYNDENCLIARELFTAHQQGVVARFWCEKGRFK